MTSIAGLWVSDGHGAFVRKGVPSDLPERVRVAPAGSQSVLVNADS